MSIKHGKIKIFLHGENYHAKEFCKQLENYEKGVFEPKYFDRLDPGRTYNEFDLFHLISSPLSVIKKLKQYKKPILYHWIGTDAYRFINDFPLKIYLKKRLLSSSNIINLVVSENLKEELNQFGISSTLLPLVKLYFLDEIPPLPQKFSVLAYVPEKSWNFYNGDLILQLAKELPEIEFHILTSRENKFQLQNVSTYYLVEDLNQLYKNCSALLRVTVHDGLPKMVLEALSFGRNVLWSYSFPHCFKVNNLNDCTTILKRLKTDTIPNIDGKNFVEKNFNPIKILSDYQNLCQKLVG